MCLAKTRIISYFISLFYENTKVRLWRCAAVPYLYGLLVKLFLAAGSSRPRDWLILSHQSSTSELLACVRGRRVLSLPQS